jgi:hypothetical protein
VDARNTKKHIEIDLFGSPDWIVNDFISAISPHPGHRLPTTMFEFDRSTMQVVGSAFPNDRFGIIQDNNIETLEITWTIESCLEMRQLADQLDCSVVKDMVSEKMFCLTTTSWRGPRHILIVGTMLWSHRSPSTR